MVSDRETQVAVAMLPFVSGLISPTSENSQQAKGANRPISRIDFCGLDAENSDMSSA